MNRRDTEFTEYVTPRRRKFRRTAYLMCGDWNQADDIVQLALVKLYRAWARVRSDQADAYVRRTISRTAIDESRRPNRRVSLPGDELLDVSPVLPAGDRVEDRSLLMTALRELPLRQRQIVVLRHWCDCSVAEVAADLKITPGTVKSQTARALERLNSLLTAQPDLGYSPVGPKGH